MLKEISVGDLQPDETVEAAREARVLSKLVHPSIVKFHDSFMDGDVFCIVTEFCEVIIYSQVPRQFYVHVLYCHQVSGGICISVFSLDI